MSIIRPLVTITSAWADAITNWINARTPVQKLSTVATSTTTTTEAKDTQVGDLTLTVTDASAWYRITYEARLTTDAASALVTIRVRDGGSSSPTNTSALIAQGSSLLSVAGGPGQVTQHAQSLRQFTVGTHNLAGFYIREAGTGNVGLLALDGGSATLSRFLIVEQIT